MKKVFLLIALLATVFASNACEKKMILNLKNNLKTPSNKNWLGSGKLQELVWTLKVMKFKKPMIVFFGNFYLMVEVEKFGYTTQNAKDCIPDDKFKVDEILFTWNIIGNDFI